MKKIIIILLVAVLLPAVIFANSFNLSLGTTNSYQKPVSTLENSFNASYLTIGPEVRMNLGFLEFGLKSVYSSDDTNCFSLEMTPDANILFDFGVLHFSLGATTSFDNPYLITFDENGSVGHTDLDTYIKSQNLAYRASVGLNFNHLYFNVDYTLPTAYQFGDSDTSTIAPIEFDTGYASVSFLYSIF